MVLCRRGGGKRAWATTTENKLSKEEKLDAKKKELFVIMLQLKESNHSATFHIMNHINESLMQGERVIEPSLPHLSIAVLQQIRSEMDSTNDVVRRCQCTGKFFFDQDTADISSAISALRLCEDALKLITTVKIWEITWTGAAGCRGTNAKTNSKRVVIPFLVANSKGFVLPAQSPPNLREF